jgi:L-malate glycosyltransferase
MEESINEKKNILIFSHSSLLGGAERSMVDLVDTILKQGFNVLVVLPGRGALEKVLRQKSIQFIIVHYCWWASPKKIVTEKYLESIANIMSSLSRFVKFNPSCVITNTSVIPWGMVTAQLLNLPHIWSIREFVEKDHGLIPEITFPELARLIYIGSEKIWFVSEAVKMEFEKFIPHDKSEVIYSQVTIPELLLREKIVSPFKYEKSFKLIMPSNISPTKGQDQAVKAIKMLINKNYNIELLLLGRKRTGNDKYLERLIKLIGSNNKDRIHISSFLDNPYPVFLMSDLTLVCSRSEAFSRIIIESGLLGKTFVASNTGGNIEMDKNTGLFYKYGNFVDLAGKIEYLINNQSIYKRMALEHKDLMQKLYGNNEIYSRTIPEQLMALKSKSLFTNTFSLIRKILELNYKEDYRRSLESVSKELESIKSSKNYRLWRKYHKIKDSFLGKHKSDE